jgi:hypothetical protein
VIGKNSPVALQNCDDAERQTAFALQAHLNMERPFHESNAIQLHRAASGHP